MVCCLQLVVYKKNARSQQACAQPTEQLGLLLYEKESDGLKNGGDELIRKKVKK